MTFWQVAAGSQGRDYSDIFLKHGIACIGDPVHEGTIQRVALDDIMVLKMGQSEIKAAGKIVKRDSKHCGCGDKDWLHDFDGWDLPAYCYVDWYRAVPPMKVSGLTRTTIERTGIDVVKAAAEQIIATGERQAPVPEPQPTKRLEDHTLLNHLLLSNLRPQMAEELVTALGRIRLLARYSMIIVTGVR